MEKGQIIEFIKKIELFKELTKDELQLVASGLQEKAYEKSELLFRENNPRKELYLIHDGEVELFNDMFTSKFLLNLNKEKKERSKVKLNFNSRDLGLLFGILSEHNLTQKNIVGKANLDFYTDFDFYRPEIPNIKLKLNSFNLIKFWEVPYLS